MIDEKRAKKLEPKYEGCADNAMELAYQIQCLMQDYLKFNGPGGNVQCQVLGALSYVRLLVKVGPQQ